MTLCTLCVHDQHNSMQKFTVYDSMCLRQCKRDKNTASMRSELQQDEHKSNSGNMRFLQDHQHMYTVCCPFEPNQTKIDVVIVISCDLILTDEALLQEHLVMEHMPNRLLAAAGHWT